MLSNFSVSHFFAYFLSYVTIHSTGQTIWVPTPRNRLSSLQKLGYLKASRLCISQSLGIFNSEARKNIVGGGILLVWCFWVVLSIFIQISLCSLTWLLTLHSPPSMEGLGFRWAPSHPSEEHISHLFCPLPFKSDPSFERISMMNHPILGC